MPTTIAIVEDNPLIAQFLSEALSDEGYAVRIYGDGRSAVAGLTMHPPDLVLLDLGLPLLSGAEVLIHIRRQVGAGLPIVIMTAGTQGPALVSEGATAFLTKPLDLNELMICIARYAAPHDSDH
jgi:DNA-binding response OmpR family regulator